MKHIKHRLSMKALECNLFTITTIVHPETRKTIRKNNTILSKVLRAITSEAPSVHCSSEHSMSPEIQEMDRSIHSVEISGFYRHSDFT